MIRLIVFLGNKGVQYAKTRHNSGWLLLESLPLLPPEASWQEKFHGKWTKASLFDVPVHLLKPMTYMNASGSSVGSMARYLSFPSDGILVVHDDIELDFGTSRLQFGGGLAGHNGLKSIAKELGSKDFFRLRIGIGRPRGLDVASFVLGRFSVEEEAELPFVWEGSARILNHWMKQGCPQKGVPSTYTLGLPGHDKRTNGRQVIE